MAKRARQAALTAVGAVIGAGFASGREIVSFFSRYGQESWLGIGTAVLVILLIARRILQAPGQGGMPTAWQGKWQSRLWQGMFLLLMLTTGGAMIAGGGEIVTLLLPGHGFWLGTGMTAALSFVLARKGRGGSALLSGIMTGVLLLIAVAGMTVQTQGTAGSFHAATGRCMLRGACYAGFNMALAVPGLAEAAPHLSPGEKRQCAWMLSAWLGVLLAAGNLLMLHFPSAKGESMPVLYLMRQTGMWGMALGCLGMYLAVLTTACAALQGAWSLWPGQRAGRHGALLAMLLCAALGFTGVVEIVYPLLGAGCLMLMAAAFLTKMQKNA